MHKNLEIHNKNVRDMNLIQWNTFQQIKIFYIYIFIISNVLSLKTEKGVSFYTKFPIHYSLVCFKAKVLKTPHLMLSKFVLNLLGLVVFVELVIPLVSVVSVLLSTIYWLVLLVFFISVIGDIKSMMKYTISSTKIQNVQKHPKHDLYFNLLLYEKVTLWSKASMFLNISIVI